MVWVKKPPQTSKLRKHPIRFKDFSTPQWMKALFSKIKETRETGGFFFTHHLGLRHHKAMLHLQYVTHFSGVSMRQIKRLLVISITSIAFGGCAASNADGFPPLKVGDNIHFSSSGLNARGALESPKCHYKITEITGKWVKVEGISEWADKQDGWVNLAQAMSLRVCTN